MQNSRLTILETILKLIAIFLAVLLLFTGCTNQDEKAQALQAVRDQASRYAFLNKGRDACQTLTGMLGYYDNATYQKAKEVAKVSEALRAEYFPTVKWQGAEILVQEIQCTIADLIVSSYNDKQIVFLFSLACDDGYYLPIIKWYRATYSIKQDMIIWLEQVCEY